MVNNLITNKTYRVRLNNGSWHDARFIREAIYKPTVRLYGPAYKTRVHYIFENLDSGKKVEIKSKVRIKDVMTNQEWESKLSGTPST